MTTGLVAALAAASCALRPRDPLPTDPAKGEKLANPFAPATMHIHGLTRTEKDAQGKLWLICHLELLDAWGDTTKTIGQVRIELLRPQTGPGSGTPELSWDVNLSDLKENVALYDAATRTYRLP